MTVTPVRPPATAHASVPPAPAGPEPTLVERYEHMAHTFERRPVDLALRLLDIAIAGTILALSTPVMAVAAVLVRLTGSPVLYRGRRVGLAGTVFTMYKFRTLRADSETRLGPYLGAELTQLTRNEQTRIGRVLRATKVDELPQLWNVVRGDMSLVGPRPIRPAFFEELCHEIPAYWQRLVIRPGMTGLAQLRLSREMSWAEKLAHDVEFIADRSVRLYLAVIVETAVKVLTGHWGV
jgi:lipopolysaccharide/colanic/teichoic acid biosynthesis glycosyltransferase